MRRPAGPPPTAEGAPPPRIIAGRHRGRRLLVPAGLALRPTAGRTREAVFDILAGGRITPDLAGAGVLDVCAGTGAYGFEALSQGAGRAVFIDRDDRALAAIAATAAAFGEREILLLAADAERLPPPPFAARAPLDFAFLDPPYGAGLVPPALAGLAAGGWLRTGGIVVIEMDAAEELVLPEPYQLLVDRRRYGRAAIVFVRLAGAG